MSESRSEILAVEGHDIACLVRPGAAPGVVWLGGYRSDMTGTKAEALDAWAARTGRAFLRHDYSGHGRSAGTLAEGTISKWLAQSLAVFHRYASGPQILVGSSMGAWIALRMAQVLQSAEPRRIAGMVLVAPAPDFTAELIEPRLSAAQRKALAVRGYIETPSAYAAEPDVYTAALIEDGRANLVLGRPLDTFCPVHVLQGMKDADVPYQHALKLVSVLPADDVTLSLVPEGDHRLSRPEDVAMLVKAVEAMIERAG